MASTFLQLAGGRANVPQRLGLETDTGLLLAMPGSLPDDAALAIKIVTVFPDNSRRGLPSIFGLVVVLDASTGAPVALVEGGRLTGGDVHGTRRRANGRVVWGRCSGADAARGPARRA